MYVQDIVSKAFARVSYTDAIQLLQKAKAKFQYPVQWGADLQSEHERYLTEQEFNGTPVFVTDYPKDIKVKMPIQARCQVTSAKGIKGC